MQIEVPERDKILLVFDEQEIEYMKKEAEDNDISVSDMVEMMFGVLFVGGYLTIVGKG